MKILLLSLNWVEYLVEMANALTALGHQVEIIVKSARVRETVGNELPRLLDPAVRAHLIDDRPKGLRDPRQLVTIARLVRLIRSISPDVINIHEATTTYLPFCLAVGGKQPIVLTVHDVTTHPGRDSEGPKRHEIVRQHFRRRAAAVILHGDWLREQYLAQEGDICRDAYVVPHGCYTVYRHWARDTVAEVPGSVLFFGRIHEYKGLDYLLRAGEIVARECPNFKIVIAGDGSDLQRYRQQVLDSPRCVLHAGYLSNERVAEIFQQASLVVLPYTEGSQSGVIRIAYVFGKPVIVTDVGSLPESVKDGVTGLVVPPRNETALAAAISELLRNDAKRHAMGEAAGRMAATDLSWSNVARQTDPIFREVLARRVERVPQSDASPLRSNS